MSNLNIAQLKEQVSQKMLYLEKLKEEKQRRVEQLKTKLDAEIVAIDSKIGSIVQQRTVLLERKQTDQKNAAQALANAKIETHKAQQSLADAKKLIITTKKTQQKTSKEAEKTLQQEFSQITKRTQNEMKVLQKQIQAEETAMAQPQQ
jgi:hypothetical protein